MTQSSQRDTRDRGVWSPKALAVFGLFFSVIPAGLMFAINYGRYGRPKERLLWGVATIFLMGALLIADCVSSEVSSPRWFLLNVLLLWFMYLRQAPLYHAWINSGRRKASVWTGLLICAGFLATFFVAGVAVSSIYEDDYLAASQIESGQYAEAEAILLEARKRHPTDMDVRFNLAIVYRLQSRPRDAVAEVDAFLKAYPTDKDALQLKADIEAELQTE